ncbi:uncharacterized protein MONBRDRAFT_12277 [Monosiga brevicollis MX1]|uniref:Uncharacterized protein n=1 Tax=Monosiga brevicollis TaxID=81824 RepID=A9VBS0_MONBE|nr:uncharacterized protein MONBRDRAFT_12277 [Monosiga brevicollis MX1]EDQ85025.1 predicted protein [Monosiga brevicollis MX1]|eukprot:XP_001750195.1 hypothetical protein [Monosiga brevicollis MX1]
MALFPDARCVLPARYSEPVPFGPSVWETIVGSAPPADTLGAVSKVSVPARAPETRAQYEACRDSWPCTFRENKSIGRALDLPNVLTPSTRQPSCGSHTLGLTPRRCHGAPKRKPSFTACRCAMALVHSRVQRAVFQWPNATGSFASHFMMHAHPGLNHRFDVYELGTCA